MMVRVLPCVFQEDEIPVPEPPPEVKPAEGEGSEAEGAAAQPPAAPPVAAAEGKDGAKKKESNAGAGEEKEEGGGGGGGEKKKEGGDGEAEAEGPVINPTRWQDSKLWVVDQDQARFLEKVGRTLHPLAFAPLPLRNPFPFSFLA